MAYADLMRAGRDFKYKYFEQEQKKNIARIYRAIKTLNAPHGYGSAYQIIDGKKRYFMKHVPNTILYNWLGLIWGGFTNSGSGSLSNGLVNTGGTVSGSGTGSATVSVLAVGGNANNNLGTDTSTATNKAFHVLVSPISHTAPSMSFSQYNPSQTVQSVTWNPIQYIIASLTFAAGATSGNPTIGEIGITQNGGSHLTSRLASADGAFSAFTINSTLALTINYQFAV